MTDTEIITLVAERLTDIVDDLGALMTLAQQDGNMLIASEILAVAIRAHQAARAIARDLDQ